MATTNKAIIYVYKAANGLSLDTPFGNIRKENLKNVYILLARVCAQA